MICDDAVTVSGKCYDHNDWVKKGVGWGGTAVMVDGGIML